MSDVPLPNPIQDVNGLTVPRYYTQDDPVLAVVDNRPLADLAQRDEDLLGKITPVSGAVDDAAGTFPTLEDRLDDMTSKLPPFTARTMQGLLDLHRPEALADFLRRHTWSGYIPVPLLTKYNPGIWRGFHTFTSHNQPLLLPLSFDKVRGINAVVNGWLMSFVDDTPAVANTSLVFTLGAAPNLIDPCDYPIQTRRDLLFLEVFTRAIDPDDVADTTNGFRKWGGIANPLVYDHKDPSVRHTLYFQSDGSWVQVCWRKRVINNINDISEPEGVDCDEVLAQGTAGSPVAGVNFIQDADDPGLFVATNVGLGTHDGKSYAINLAYVSRRNNGVYSKTNPNGTATPGPVGGNAVSGVSGHPLGYYHDAVYDHDILDRRHITGWEEREFSGRAKHVVVDLLRGELRTMFGFSTADPDGNLESEDLGPRGTRVLAIDAISPTVFNSDEKVNWLNLDPEGRTQKPDDVRYQWDDADDVQLTPFTFVEGDADSEFPPNLCTYDPLTQVVTLQTTGLSGAPTIGTQNLDLRWKSDGSLVQFALGWSGLGTTSASGKIFNNGHVGDVVHGRVELIYASGGGLRHAMSRVGRVDNSLETVRHSVIQTPVKEELSRDSGLTTLPAQSIGKVSWERVEYVMPMTSNTVTVPRPLPKAGSNAHLSEIREDATKALVGVTNIVQNVGNWTITMSAAYPGGTKLLLDFESGPGVNGNRTFHFCGSRHALQNITKWEQVTVVSNGVSTHYRPAYAGNGLVQGTAGLNRISNTVSGLSGRDYAMDASGVMRPFTIMAIDGLGPFGWQYIDVIFDSPPAAGNLTFYLVVTDAPTATERLMIHYEHVPYQGDFFTREGQVLRGFEIVNDLGAKMVASILGSQICQNDPIDQIEALPVPDVPGNPVRSHRYSAPGGIRVGLQTHIETAINRTLPVEARNFSPLLWLPATMSESPVNDQLAWFKHSQIGISGKIDMDVVPAGLEAVKGQVTYMAGQDEFQIFSEPLDTPVPHWNLVALLVRSGKKLFVLVISGFTTGDQNVVTCNYSFAGPYHDTFCAFDLFEIPGRPLLKG